MDDVKEKEMFIVQSKPPIREAPEESEAGCGVTLAAHTFAASAKPA